MVPLNPVSQAYSLEDAKKLLNIPIDPEMMLYVFVLSHNGQCAPPPGRVKDGELWVENGISFQSRLVALMVYFAQRGIIVPSMKSFDKIKMDTMLNFLRPYVIAAATAEVSVRDEPDHGFIVNFTDGAFERIFRQNQTHHH